jgi:SNF2 family DNA or RNA helicase
LGSFLSGYLQGAVVYRRIAGYFRSSILDLTGEELARIPDVKIVCNAELDPRDLQVAVMARDTIAQRLLGVWRNLPPGDAIVQGPERYRRLYDLLTAGNLHVRVVPKGRVFVHGKAGVITYADGSRTSFVGSTNETLSAFAHNYEIVWEDPSLDAVAWVDDEFDLLWNDPDAVDLPDAVIDDVRRMAERIEVAVADLTPRDVPPAFLTETPLHDAGSLLQPWQRAFVDTFVQHREAYGQARLLIADEVGLGKTLSLATCAVVGSLLGDGPVLILAPATLTLQWQTELLDKLGVPSVVWHSARKGWLTPEGAFIPSTPEGIARAPMQIAIVSTGLLFRSDSVERAALQSVRYGTVVLDEAHKARAAAMGARRQPNNLMAFMLDVAPRTRHLLLGTATPMQLHVDEVWDLLAILAQGNEHVLGDGFSLWRRGDDRTELVQRDLQGGIDVQRAWAYLRNPVPHAISWPEAERVAGNLYRDIRLDLAMPPTTFVTDRSIDALSMAERDVREVARSDRSFFRRHNPIIRHTVLRRRKDLEDAGLLPRVGVRIHPEPDAPAGAYAPLRATFNADRALHAPPAYAAAYERVEAFLTAYVARRKNALLRPLLLQRVCSSVDAGIATLERFLDQRSDEGFAEDADADPLDQAAQEGVSSEERRRLQEALVHLAAARTAGDPKYQALRDTLLEFRTDGRTWFEHGCIVFSQYYDTARPIAERLAAERPDTPIALYAGADRSRLYHQGRSSEVARERIKAAVRDRTVALVIATDAAAEGLNLQTLGTLINVDLPWNPARLEQRVGRIRRIGQTRRTVDVMNLVYAGTQDERVYRALSRRMAGAFDLFGKIPDVLDDEWIDDVEGMLEKMERYLHLEPEREDVFGDRYRGTLVDADRERWSTWSRVLTRRDVRALLSKPWGGRS